MGHLPADPSDFSALAGVAPELAAAFASLGSDIALVIDDTGVIRNVALGNDTPDHPARGWVGRAWTETVTGDTRVKIERLLAEVEGPGVSRRREVQHPSPIGEDIPVSYAAVRLGLQGPVIAAGRDLRTVAAIQQRFLEAQKEMERDYWQLRREATHQQQLLQVATDAVLVVDAQTRSVEDGNAVALSRFGPRGTALPHALAMLVDTALRTGRTAEVRTRLDLSPRAPQVDLSATPFRATVGDASIQRLLLRVRDATDDGTSPEGESVVIVDASGRVLAANSSLIAMCRAPNESPVGRTLGEVLGDPRRQLAALLSDVRHEGLVHAADMLLGGGGVSTWQADAHASLMAGGDQECIGITIRRSAVEPQPQVGAWLLASLIDQVGAVPLAELVRRASDLAERGAIEAALRRTSDDLAKAAALLGVTEADLQARQRRLGPA